MDDLPVNKRFELNSRLAPLFLFTVFFLLLVLIRILYLQVGLGREFEKMSEVNRITHRTVPAVRGAILDSQGRVIAADQPMFQLVRAPGKFQISEEELTSLSEILMLDSRELRDRLKAPGQRYLVKNLSDEQRIRFSERATDFSGLTIEIHPHRVYNRGEVVGPVTGYIGEIDPPELSRRRREGLSQGEIVGKTGLEKVYDTKLRGRDGLKWIETTAAGNYLRTLENPSQIRPVSGEDIRLNLDLELQESVADLFGADSTGAVFVMEIPGGEVRALYSYPTYDPNSFVFGDREQIDRILSNSHNPLLNRAVQSRHPPGSTFKILPFVAALEAPGFGPERVFDCGGYFQSGNRRFHCWREEGHGELTLREALVHSCNVYFYNLARELNYSRVQSLAARLEFNKKTGIDLPQESSSQLSTPELLKNIYQRRWTEGEAINAMIGQGYTVITPVKQGQLLAGLLTGGMVVPRLLQTADPVRVRRAERLVSEQSSRELLEAMNRVTREGTGYRARYDENYRASSFEVAGKTGTAQKAQRRETGEGPAADAWFVSAVPASAPRFVVVVYLAGAGSAARTAAPFARKIYGAMERLGYFLSENSIGEAIE